MEHLAMRVGEWSIRTDARGARVAVRATVGQIMNAIPELAVENIHLGSGTR